MLLMVVMQMGCENSRGNWEPFLARVVCVRNVLKAKKGNGMGWIGGQRTRIL